MHKVVYKCLIQIISGFLRVFLRKKDKFIIVDSGPISKWELKPKKESMKDILERLSNGERIDLTANQMESYFKNLSPSLSIFPLGCCDNNHPKFDSLNYSTKYFHHLVKERILLHKKGVGDKGAKTVGEKSSNVNKMLFLT